MTKKELQKIALKLYNQGLLNFENIFCHKDLKYCEQSEVYKCLDYIDELIRAGKAAFKKKYCIK